MKYLSDFKSYLSVKKRWVIFIGYILMISNLYFSYGFTLLIPQEMGIDNPYLNGVLIGLADICGFTIVYFFIDKYSRKAFHKFHLLNMILYSIILFFLQLILSENSQSLKILESIFSGKINQF
jgi:hypothetical protein